MEGVDEVSSVRTSIIQKESEANLREPHKKLFNRQLQQPRHDNFTFSPEKDTKKVSTKKLGSSSKKQTLSPQSAGKFKNKKKMSGLFIHNPLDKSSNKVSGFKTEKNKTGMHGSTQVLGDKKPS